MSAISPLALGKMWGTGDRVGGGGGPLTVATLQRESAKSAADGAAPFADEAGTARHFDQREIVALPGLKWEVDFLGKVAGTRIRVCVAQTGTRSWLPVTRLPPIGAERQPALSMAMGLPVAISSDAKAAPARGLRQTRKDYRRSVGRLRAIRGRKVALEVGVEPRRCTDYAC